MVEQNLPLHNAVNDVMAQVDETLLALRNTHANDHQKVLRELERSDQKLLQKEAEIKLLESKVAQCSADLAVTKAQLLSELLDAERKVKHFEHEFNEAKHFITQHVLAANETVSKLIRFRYGDGNELAFMNTAQAAPAAIVAPGNINMPLELSNAIEEISASSTLFSVPAIDLETTEPTNAQTESATDSQAVSQGQSQPVERSDDDVVLIESDNEQMETDECAVRFPCDQCPKVFTSLALKYRHESKAHGNARDIGREVKRDARNFLKPLKRLASRTAAKKMAEKIRIQNELQLEEFADLYRKYTPVMKQLKREQRAKKMTGRKL